MRRFAFLAFLVLSACSSSPANPPGPDGGTGGSGPSGPPCSDGRFADGRVSAQCEQMVDVEGRVVFLRGVNARVEGIFDVTFDDGRIPLEPIPPFTIDDAERMRAMGF